MGKTDPTARKRKMRGVFLLIALGVPFVSTQEFEMEFVPAARGQNFFKAAQSRMEAMAHNMEEMMHGDAAAPMKRGQSTEVKRTFLLPGAQIEIDVQMGKGPMGEAFPHPLSKGKGKGFFAKMKKRSMRMAKMMKRRMQAVRHGIMHRMKRLQHMGVPQWMHKLSHGSQFFHMKKMNMIWLRKAIFAHCPEAEQLCPRTKCPKKLAKCLHRQQDQVEERCGAFLQKLEHFKAKKKAAKRKFHQAKKRCKKLEILPEDRRTCVHAARKAKRASLKEIRNNLKEALNGEADLKEAQAPKSIFTQAEKTFEAKMEGLKDMLEGLAGKKPKPAETKKKKESKVEKKVKVETKKPKEEKKAPKEEKKAPKEEKKADMTEGTPAYLTGDMEAPKGEKDMGGWTMRAYTPEQQARLRVDEQGRPKPEVTKKEIDQYVNKPDVLKKYHWSKAIATLKAKYFYGHHAAFEKFKAGELDKQAPETPSTLDRVKALPWLLLLVVGAAIALVISVALVHRYRVLKQSVELRAVYDQTKIDAPVRVAVQEGSDNQV